MTLADSSEIARNPPQENPPRPHRRPGTLHLFTVPRSYNDTLALQRQLHADRCAGLRPDLLLLLEHEPIYTMGRRTQPTHWNGNEHLLQRLGATLETVDRGGSITFHGPGQLIGYPILGLSGLCSGPKAYVLMLERVLIDTLNFFGVQCYRIEKRPGIWTQSGGSEAKLASIGIRYDRGVTMHGFALNVDPDLTAFSHIMPCGIDRCRMSSMVEILGEPVSTSVVALEFARHFANIFHLEWSSGFLDDAPSVEIMRSHAPDTLSPAYPVRT